MLRDIQSKNKKPEKKQKSSGQASFLSISTSFASHIDSSRYTARLHHFGRLRRRRHTKSAKLKIESFFKKTLLLNVFEQAPVIICYFVFLGSPTSKTTNKIQQQVVEFDVM